MKRMHNYTLTIFTKEASGGTGKFLQILSQLNDEYRLRYVFLKKDRYKNTTVKGETFVTSYSTNDSPSFQKLRQFFQLFVLLYRRIKSESSDAFIACDPYSIAVLGLLKPFFPRKIFVAIHHIDISAYFSGKPNIVYRSLLNIFFLFAVRQFTHHIYVSTDLERAMNKQYGLNPHKTNVIYNGIEAVTKVRNAVPPSGDSPHLITVGRLNKQKDYSTILKSFALMKKELPHARLTIVSDGDTKQRLVEEISALGIEKETEMTGWVTSLDEYLRKSDIFLFASHYEGFGITIVEAMAAGLPVIVTDTPYGPGELTGKGRYGIIVPMGDSEAMANKTIECIKNKNLWKKYQQAGFERAREFTIERMVENYRNVFARIIKLNSV